MTLFFFYQYNDTQLLLRIRGRKNLVWVLTCWISLLKWCFLNIHVLFLHSVPGTFQCALLYTTVYGQRRIRVINLSLSCTSLLSNLFRYADLETQFACFLKQGKNSKVRFNITLFTFSGFIIFSLLRKCRKQKYLKWCHFVQTHLPWNIMDSTDILVPYSC